MATVISVIAVFIKAENNAAVLNEKISSAATETANAPLNKVNIGRYYH
jgi:hypothetical protein